MHFIALLGVLNAGLRDWKRMGSVLEISCQLRITEVLGTSANGYAQVCITTRPVASFEQVGGPADVSFSGRCYKAE